MELSFKRALVSVFEGFRVEFCAGVLGFSFAVRWMCLGLGCGLWGLGFWVLGVLGFRVLVSGCGAQGSEAGRRCYWLESSLKVRTQTRDGSTASSLRSSSTSRKSTSHRGPGSGSGRGRSRDRTRGRGRIRCRCRGCKQVVVVVVVAFQTKRRFAKYCRRQLDLRSPLSVLLRKDKPTQHLAKKLLLPPG